MRTRKAIAHLLAISCVSMLVAGAAMSADTVGLSTSLDTSYLSKFVFRGIQQTDDPVVAVGLKMQFPSGLTYQVTGFDNTERIATGPAAGPAGKVFRNEHQLSYPVSFLGQKVDLGWNYYGLKGAGTSSTQELSAGLGFNCMFNPTVKAYWDIQQSHGMYVAASGNYAFTLPYVKALDLTVGVGYADKTYAKANYPGAKKAGLFDGTACVKTSIKLPGKLTLVPSVSYSYMIDQDVRNALDAAKLDKDITVWGATLQTTF